MIDKRIEEVKETISDFETIIKNTTNKYLKQGKTGTLNNQKKELQWLEELKEKIEKRINDIFETDIYNANINIIVEQELLHIVGDVNES